MTCLLTNGAVFYHIPKTGGTWVYGVLEELGLVEARLGHVHADHFHALWNRVLLKPTDTIKNLVAGALGCRSQTNARIPDKPYSFCFVREPLSWYGSYWKYMQWQGWPAWGEEGNPRNWHPCAILNGLASDNFQVFVKRVISKRPGFLTELYGNYTPPSVNFIGHQETLASDLLTVLDNLGLSVGFALESRLRANVSEASVGHIAWDPQLAREVVQLEFAAYRRYRYSPEEALAKALSPKP